MLKLQSTSVYVIDRRVTQCPSNVTQATMARRLQGASRQHGNRLNFERVLLNNSTDVFSSFLRQGGMPCKCMVAIDNTVSHRAFSLSS